MHYEPAFWTVEVHTVEVYVGNDGIHQDEFLPEDSLIDLMRKSIVMPSFDVAILNRKYVDFNHFYWIRNSRKTAFLSADRTWQIGQSYIGYTGPGSIIGHVH